MHKCVNNTIGNVYHLEQWVDNFFPYSQEQLGFDKPVSIIFQSDEDNAAKMLGKTAYYDPEQLEVVLYTDGRHPKDVMRSLSHELVHHAQNCRGDFTSADSTSPGYAQEDPHLRDMEREAYERGNLIFRDFEDLIKTGKINIEIDFSDSGEPKMSLKEWKNNELNTKLMKKWGLLKEGKLPAGDAGHGGPEDEHYQFDKKEREAELQEDSEGEETYHYGEDEGEDDKELHDLVKRHATKSHIDALKRDMDYDEDHEDRRERGDHFREGTEEMEEGIFSPNHYCVHHGGVQHEGQIKMAEAISHNFDKSLNKVTWYDMKLQDGTILEQVDAEEIMVTNASLAEGHSHPMRDEDEDDLEENAGKWAKIADEEEDPTDVPGFPRAFMSKDKTAPKKKKAKRPHRDQTVGGRNVFTTSESTKISVREAKEITRRIIERVKQENK
jgi:hypothetical protein